MPKVWINTQRELHQVNKNIFGHFHEHAFGNIYGGVYDPQNPLADEDGFRTDVLAALRKVGVPILRYPGGNFVSNYHWQEGIGPKKDRKSVFEYAWLTEESNQFGTADFIKFCRKVGAEPYLCINMGSGSIEEAMQWVEYCNGTGNTYFANLRRQHGYPEPFNVMYWGLGNEMYGPWQMGYLNAQDYAKKAVEFAKAMKWADRSIKLVACGYEQSIEWNLEAISKLESFIDYISAHHYSVGWGPFDRENTMQLLSISEYMKRLNDITKTAINCACQKDKGRIKIAWDEWNMFGWIFDGADDDQTYTLLNALVTASILNFFIRNSDSIAMANYSTFVNINGAIRTYPDRIILRPQYHAFDLIGNNTGEILVDCHVQGPTYSVSEPHNPKMYAHDAVNLLTYELDYIDAVATTDQEFIYISVVNKHLTDVLPVEFVIDGCQISPATEVALSLSHKEITAANTLEQPENVQPHALDCQVTGNIVFASLPRHSIHVIKLRRL